MVIRQVSRLSFSIRFMVRVQTNALSHASCPNCGFAARSLFARFDAGLLWVNVTNAVSRTVIGLSDVTVANLPSRFRGHAVAHNVRIHAQVHQRIRTNVGFHYSMSKIGPYPVAKYYLPGILVKCELSNKGAFRRLVVVFARYRCVIG